MIETCTCEDHEEVVFPALGRARAQATLALPTLPGVLGPSFCFSGNVEGLRRNRR